MIEKQIPLDIIPTAEKARAITDQTIELIERYIKLYTLVRERVEEKLSVGVDRLDYHYMLKEIFRATSETLDKKIVESKQAN